MRKVKVDSFESKFRSYGYIVIGILLTPFIIGIPMLIIGIINLVSREKAIKTGQEKTEVKINQLKTTFNTGLQYFREENYSVAIEVFNGLLSDPNITDEFKMILYGILARSYFLQDDWQAAATASYQQFSISKSVGKPLNFEDYLVRIECLLKVNDLKQAQEVLNSAKWKFEGKSELEQLEIKMKLLEMVDTAANGKISHPD